MPYVELKGVNYYYAGEPDKDALPLLFCHGSGGSHRHWLYQLKGLGEAVNLLAVDLPGHGLSGGKPADSIAVYRDWVREFAAALELAPFVLGGHSMGGGIALDYALHYPGDLAGLVLVATGGRLRVAPAILESFREGQVPPDMVSYAYGRDADPVQLDRGRREMENTDAAVYLADFTACDRFDIMERLPEINLPSLVVSGTDDRLTPVKYSRYLEQHLPRGELAEVAGAGHMVMLEAPEAVNRAVTRFMAKLARS